MPNILSEQPPEKKIPGMLMLVANWNLIISTVTFIAFLELFSSVHEHPVQLVIDTVVGAVTVVLLVLISTLVIREDRWILRSEQIALVGVAGLAGVHLLLGTIFGGTSQLIALITAAFIAIDAVVLFSLTAPKINLWFNRVVIWPTWIRILLGVWGATVIAEILTAIVER